MRGGVSQQSWHRRVVQPAVLKRFVHLSCASMSASQKLFAASEVSNLLEARGSGSEACGVLCCRLKRSTKVGFTRSRGVCVESGVVRVWKGRIERGVVLSSIEATHREQGALVESRGNARESSDREDDEVLGHG